LRPSRSLLRARSGQGFGRGAPRSLKGVKTRSLTLQVVEHEQPASVRRDDQISFTGGVRSAAVLRWGRSARALEPHAPPRAGSRVASRQARSHARGALGSFARGASGSFARTTADRFRGSGLSESRARRARSLPWLLEAGRFHTWIARLVEVAVCEVWRFGGADRHPATSLLLRHGMEGGSPHHHAEAGAHGQPKGSCARSSRELNPCSVSARAPSSLRKSEA
jgi:hypothetical protein